ncbi:MAG: hypothetical protein WDN50_14465 [Bradyrhizobium sp.]
MASLLGLGTTSSSMLGAAIGLYLPISKRLLACLLAFAAGSLISALAIELAYEGALSLHHRGFDARAAWLFVSAGFAVGRHPLLHGIAGSGEKGSRGALRHPVSRICFGAQTG